MPKPELNPDEWFAVNVFGWRYYWFVFEGDAQSGERNEGVKRLGRNQYDWGQYYISDTKSKPPTRDDTERVYRSQGDPKFSQQPHLDDVIRAVCEKAGLQYVEHLYVLWRGQPIGADMLMLDSVVTLLGFADEHRIAALKSAWIEVFGEVDGYGSSVAQAESADV